MKLINPEYFSPIQSDAFKAAAREYNHKARSLQIARIQESIEKLESLTKLAADEHKDSPLYYPVVDRCDIALEHLRALLDYVTLNH